MAGYCDEDKPGLAKELLSNYTILENGPDSMSGSWTYLHDRDEFLWSEGMYNIFEIDPDTRPRPDIYIEYAVDEEKDVARRIVNGIYEGDNFDEYLYIKTDETVKYLRVVGVTRDVSGSRRTVGVDLDLTDQFGRERPWTKDPSYQQLKKSDKAKTAFFTNISQEFQNPMTLVLESISKVVRKVGSDIPDSALKDLHAAQRNAVRIEKLVRMLNDFTHLEHRKEVARYVPADICKLATEIAASFRPIFEKAGLSLSVRCERVHEPVYVDYSIFETVLSNLLSNAFKFTFEGGVTVSVFNGRKHVRISVADTGNGINPALQKKIFQRFAKFETGNARSLDGIGIGLPLVKELVELHGGNITVNSEPKKGSEFIVSFPKGVAHIPEDKLVTNDTKYRGTLLRGTIGELESWPARDVVVARDMNDQRLAPTVIVAESDREMRGYISRSLRSKYKILEADTGRQVLEIIESGNVPDLIVADVALPRMDGFELLSTIRNSSILATLPFILLTTRTGADQEVKSLYFGADDYLLKPFSSQELMARVEARIENAIARKKPMQSLTKANTVLEERVHHYMKELEHSNRELNEKNAKLTAMNEELTGLTFAASHDLREPMRKIRLFVGRLVKEEKENLSGNGAHYFQRILSLVQSMNDLVNDVTLYANIKEMGSISNISLNVMLSSLIDFLGPFLREKGASIRFDVTDGLIGDYEQVKQALYNLISNALKFAKKDVPLEINITGKLVQGASIDSERADRTKTYYQVSVADNGIGIDPSYTKQIFELFRKLHEKSAYPGTGVGLTIVKKIMQNHNGFVIVESKLSEGATFSCFFPVKAS